ncbi:hypothetical protein [Mangrovimonas spongiae]|uniref:Lipocalin-like domain-containing protein n=1 Tax=Mangrovimonas spongiae TaxID=2494697 RepID=A0A3R9NRS7_9FLAO|nr:hypothetical protein [Mangrovimonas spongiae]RSK40259.1 hypothetical protein EJA19_04570 [Mangrovimonas spongiae]
MKTNSKIIYLFALLLITIMSCSQDDNPFINENNNNNPDNETSYTLDDLQGTWLRTGGNHEGNEGMIINIIDENGVIVDPVTSGFEIDDVKWMNIQADDINDFTHSELGSDYNYYSANINFQSDDVIWISVDASGAGNYQEWTRQ